MKHTFLSRFFGGVLLVAFLCTPFAQSFAANVPRTETRSTPEIEGQRIIDESNPIRFKKSAAPSTLAPSAMITSMATLSATANVGPNLIENPSVETTGSASLPSGWFKGGYGTNTRVLTYPVTGYDGASAVQTKISAYTSGDAKWYFAEVPVTAGKTYEFSDYYTSDVPSILTAQFKSSSGTYSYKNIANLDPASSFTQATAQFIIPNNIVSVTIFHLINQVGTLTTDMFSLNEVTTDTPPTDPTNLVPNPQLETTNSSSLPESWSKGRWGTNTAVFTFPATGVNGSKAAKVTISNYSTGDAKWYFTPVPVTTGTYTFSDQYMSDKTTYITAQFENTDGSLTYKDLATVPPATSFTEASATFNIPSTVKKITIFHLIKAVGYLTIDNVSLKTNSTPPSDNIFTTGAVSFSFDDGWDSHYKIAVPKLDSYGYKGTFYIVTEQLLDYGYDGFVSKSNILDMQNRGHEIGAHTRTHADLPTLSASEQQDEINGSQTDLKQLGIKTVNSFAYPYGDYDSTTLNILRNSTFQNARATIDGDVTPDSDKYQLERFSVESNTTLAQAKAEVDKALAQKKWLILTFHRIDTSGDQYSNTPTIFRSIVDYVKQKNAKVVTVSEGAAQI